MEIITSDTAATGAASDFVTDVNAWLEAAQGTVCVQFQDLALDYATPCTVVIPQPTQPNPGAYVDPCAEEPQP